MTILNIIEHSHLSIFSINQIYKITKMIKRVYLALLQSSTRYYKFSDMKIKVNEENYLVLDHKIGARVLELKLAGKKIIKGELHGLGNSSYLMFPWVNRIETVPFPNVQHPYTDSNGLPIHGLYVDSPRNVTIFSVSQQSIGIELTPEVKYPDVPTFVQTLILSKGKLQQKIKVQNTAEHKLPFCFGYHPYLQIDQEEIKNLDLKTDIKVNLALDERLVTIFPFVRKQIAVKSTEIYDSLFEGGTYLQIANKDGFHVKISSSLPYWQIYTPPDGKRIAVEPMSFVGNLYQISQQGHTPNLTEGAFCIEAWQQK